MPDATPPRSVVLPPIQAKSTADAVPILVDRFRHLAADDQVVELRALKVRRGRERTHTESGYFDGAHRAEMIHAALEVTKFAKGVYATLNVVNPELLARRCNRIDWAEDGELTTDKDVVRRTRLLVDVDPVRDSHVSATDAEKALSEATARTARQFLREKGWAEPVLADSGNGYHLIYAIDLPADDGGLVKRVLEGLAAKFDTAAVKIDKKVFNPARICKLPGTIARKGDQTETRKHRRARLLEVPVEPSVVTEEQLRALADELSPPPPPPPPSANGTFTSRLKVGEWLTDKKVGYRVKPEPDDKGRTVYVLDRCPFNDAHGADACVTQAADGTMGASCFHDGCAGKNWQAFKEKLGKPGPGHYDPPFQPTRKATLGKPASATGDKTGPDDPQAPDGPGTPPAGGPTIIPVDPTTTLVRETMGRITDILLGTGECYRRADQLVRITGSTIIPILSAPELAGQLNAHAEVMFVGDESQEYRPLPPSYGNTWLNHPRETARFPAITLFTLNPVFTQDWTLTPPGYDPVSGIYYAGEAVEARAGTARLDALLKDFCFKTPGDRTNYEAMLVTAILMPRFIGSKPAVIFNGNQPGLGKTMLAQLIAILRDGRPVETASYNPNDEEFEKRLGAIVKRGRTTVIIDNAKTRNGRAARIDSPCLERSITDDVLSYRLLGYSAEIRAENSHIFCLTANGPDVSRDLITRSVVVNLQYEGDPARRTFTFPDPEGYAREHRAELLGELVGLVERWREAGSPMAEAASRFNKKGWGPIVGGVLAENGFRDFLVNAAEAAEELDDTRRDFAHLVALLVAHPQGIWTPTELAEYARQQDLFPVEFEPESARGRVTNFGRVASRFVGVTFTLPDGREATFQRSDGRNGSEYKVAVEPVDDTVPD